MAKNRFAQLQYGKVIYIFETDLKKSQLSTIFEPTTYWVDVTGQKCEEGWIAEFKEGIGLVFVKPPNSVYTLEDEKEAKIAEFKKIREERGVSPIFYNENLYDYDSASQEKMRERRQYMEDTNTPASSWITFTNKSVMLTLDDFKNINSIAADRRFKLNEKYNVLKLMVLDCKDKNSVNSLTFDMDIPELS